MINVPVLMIFSFQSHPETSPPAPIPEAQFLRGSELAQ
jgi:hypothetical protein